jgi:TM2 domain-containing membrane protein YozV
MDGTEMARVRSDDEKFCMDCGRVIHLDAAFCPDCGVQQAGIPAVYAPPTLAPNGKSKTTAGVLALLLGGIGVHKMYLGEWGMGILYLLFFWTMIPGIVSFIEGIILLTMRDEAFVARYGYR